MRTTTNHRGLKKVKIRKEGLWTVFLRLFTIRVQTGKMNMASDVSNPSDRESNVVMKEVRSRPLRAKNGH